MFISQEWCGASWIYETSMSPSAWLCRSSVDSGTAPLRRIRTLDAWIATSCVCRPYCTGGTGTAYPGGQAKRYLHSKQACQIILKFLSRHYWLDNKSLFLLSCKFGRYLKDECSLLGI